MLHRFLTKFSAASACSGFRVGAANLAGFGLHDKTLVQLYRSHFRRTRGQVIVTRLLSRRPKDVVPKRRADAVSGVVISVMMAKMILLQPKPHPAFHGEMMRRVMEHVVADITENQSGKDCRRQTPENQKEDGVKEKSQWDADAGRHDESPRVTGIIVMNAVDDVVQPFSDAGFRFVMKDVPVDEILEQRPEQNAQQEQRSHCHER